MMQKLSRRRVLQFVSIVVVAVAVAACAAPAPTTAPAAPAAAQPTAAPAAAQPTPLRPLRRAGKAAVGVVLPTKDEPRWLQDQAVFEKAGCDPAVQPG